MKLTKQLFSVFALTLMALGLFLAILFNVNPDTTDLITQITFFISLFIFLSGLFTFIGFYLRVYLSNHEIIYANFPIALRQAILVSLLIVGLLALNALRVLNIWSGIIFVLILIIIELFFRSKQ